MQSCSSNDSIELLTKTIEDCIDKMPEEINVFRDMRKFYDVGEAYSLMNSNLILEGDYEMHEKLKGKEDLLSDDGIQNFASVVTNL